MAGERPLEVQVKLNMELVKAALTEMRDRIRSMGGSIRGEMTQAAISPFMSQLSTFSRGFGTMIGEANIPLGAQRFAAGMTAYQSAKEQTAEVFQWGGTMEQAKAYYAQLRPIEEMKERNKAAIRQAISGEEQKNQGEGLLEALIKIGEKMDKAIGHVEWIKNLLGGV